MTTGPEAADGEAEPAMRLDRLDHLPLALTGLAPHEVRQVLPHPTLISIAGARRRPLFISTLLHGNETTAFYVLQALAERFAHVPPPRSLLIFVGNVYAAEARVRRLPGQADFNRIWAGGDGAAPALAAEVRGIAREAELFASIDIHNNTGANPHYGCVSALRPADLHLAATFARIGVFYHIPRTTQSVVFSDFCPAVTLECGTSGDRAGIEHAIRFVERIIELEHFPNTPPANDALRLYHTIARVELEEAASFSFGDSGVDLVLHDDLESMNFKELPRDTLWAVTHTGRIPFLVRDEHGADLTETFFRLEDGRVLLNRTVTPAMLTRDRRVIRQDCLCYLMTPL